MTPPIDPTFLTAGPEWSVGLGDSGAAAGPKSTGFGDALAGQLDRLESMQTDAAKASQSLADGTATDPSSVVVAVERARLAMQLAAQIRTKSVEAISEVMRTQV